MQAPGKLFWIGEYVVLDGGPAVVAAVDRYAIVDRTQSTDGALSVKSALFDEPLILARDGEWAVDEAPPESGLVLAVAETLCERGLADLRPGRVQIDTSALAADSKYGLGSSGAVCAGLCRALARAGVDDETLVRAALDSHHRFQGGVGSGADVLASMHGGLLRVGDVDPTTVPMPEDLSMAAIFTGSSANTRSMVRALRSWRSEHSSRARTLLDALVEVAGRGCDALERGDVGGWIDAVADYADAERALTAASGVPIVNEPVERCIGVATEAGWVAKPSGAGGGDIVVAFAPRGALGEDLAAACRRAGVELLPIQIARDGLLAQRPGHVSRQR